MKLASGGRFRIEPWLAEGLIPASPRTQPDQEPGVQATRGPQPRTSDWSPIWSTTLTNPPINKFKTKDGGARYVPSNHPHNNHLNPWTCSLPAYMYTWAYTFETPSTLSSKSAARGGSETAARTNVKTCPSWQSHRWRVPPTWACRQRVVSTPHSSRVTASHSITDRRQEESRNCSAFSSWLAGRTLQSLLRLALRPSEAGAGTKGLRGGLEGPCRPPSRLAEIYRWERWL